jgi:hypothetical protein
MLIFLMILILGATIIEWYTLNQATLDLTYSCHASQSAIEPGEPFEVITHLQNNRRFPVLFVRMQENLPSEIQIRATGVDQREIKGGLYLYSTHFLLPRQRIVRRFPASLPERGRYFFRGATLFSGDFLGFRESGKFYPQMQEIVVYPASLQCPTLMERLGGYLGDFTVRRFIHEDPIAIIGYQEYTGREPQKAINWQQSARLGRLMVKKYDHTQDFWVSIILNVALSDSTSDKAKLLEACFSCTRATIEYFEKRHIKYEFQTNATAAGAINSWSHLEEGLGNKHRQTLLEGLGRATYDSTQSYGQLLSRAQKRARQGQGHVIITPNQPLRYNRYLDRLQALTGVPNCLLKAEDLLETDT